MGPRHSLKNALHLVQLRLFVAIYPFGIVATIGGAALPGVIKKAPALCVLNPSGFKITTNDENLPPFQSDGTDFSLGE